MTGAQQMVRLLLPQADRAANMCADLGVAQDAADLPCLAGGRNGDRIGIHPDHDDRSLGLFNLVLRTFQILEVRRLAVDQLTDLNILGLDRFERDVVDDSNAWRPDGPLDGLGALLFRRPRPKVGESDDHGQQDRRNCGNVGCDR